MNHIVKVTVLVLVFVSMVFATGTVTVVAEKTFLAQSSTPITTLYTPAGTGNFRVCGYATETTNGMLLSVEFQWTDESAQAKHVVFSNGGNGQANGTAAGCAPLRALSGTNITVQASDQSGGIYDLYAQVEKLP